MSNVYYTGYRLYDFQEIYEKFQRAGAKEHLRHDSKSKDLEKSTSLYLHGPFDIDTDLNERSRKWREGSGYVMDVIASHYGRKVADTMFDKVSPLTRRPLRDEITRGDLDALRTELKKHQPLPVMLLQDYEHVKSGPISDALISRMRNHVPHAERTQVEDVLRALQSIYKQGRSSGTLAALDKTYMAFHRVWQRVDFNIADAIATAYRKCR